MNEQVDELATDKLIGRTAELQRVHYLIDSVSDAGGSLVVVGEAGVGKTALLHSARSYAVQRGLNVLVAAGVESESELPYAGLVGLLQPLASYMPRLVDTQRSALNVALGLDGGAAPEPFLVGMATLSLLAEAAGDEALFLAIDDAQWLDLPTQQALAFVSRRIERERIVVLITIRAGIDSSLANARLDELQLATLTEPAAKELLARHASDLSGSDRRLILAQAAGNPLALVELPLAWRFQPEPIVPSDLTLLPLTARLERTFAGRYRSLPSRTRDVLLIAALDSREDLPEILQGAVELSDAAITVDDLSEAVDAGLIRVDSTRLRFRHPLVRSGIVQAESIARRHAGNAALASVVAAEPYRRAWFRAHSVVGPDETIADELADSHSVALQRGSVTSAIWALERAAELTADSSKRGRRLLSAAELAFGLGRADVVDRLLVSALDTDLSPLDHARMEWIREIFNDGVPGDTVRVSQLCDAARMAADAGDVDLALNLLLGAGLRCWWANTTDAARSNVIAVTESLGADGDPRYVAILAITRPVTLAARVSQILDSVQLESIADADALRLLGMAAHAIGDSPRAIDLLSRAEGRLREQGRLGLLSHVLAMQMYDHLEVGDLQRAALAVDETRRLAQETGQPIWDAGSMSISGIHLAMLGEVATAESIATEVEVSANGRSLNDLLACVQLIRGSAAASARQYDRAWAELLRLFDESDVAFHPTERYHAVGLLAESAVRCGREREAQQVIDGLEQEALITPSPNLHVGLSYARAVLAADSDAEALFQAGLSQNLGRWPWPRARLELAYGSWLRRHRKVAESRQLLRSAQRTFDVIGATSWANQAREELRASGERVEQIETPAASMLSPQEVQIAQLASEGLSNRQIGEKLFLSPRTVGSHLYRIFPKLGITGRAQLAARLQSLDA